MLTTFLITMTALCLLEIGLAIPLVARRVKPNALYGLRTSDTFASEWVWYEANAASGRDLLKLAAIQLVGLYLPLVLWEPILGYYIFGNLALVGVGTLAWATIGIYRAHHLRKKLSHSAG